MSSIVPQRIAHTSNLTRRHRLAVLLTVMGAGVALVLWQAGRGGGAKPADAAPVAGDAPVSAVALRSVAGLSTNAAPAVVPGPLQYQQSLKALPAADQQSLWATFEAARRQVRPLSFEDATRPHNLGVRYFAANPRQQLTARFLDGQVRVESGQGGNWALTLQYGEHRTEPWAEGERVEYRHGEGVTEWYVNRPQGLEHGFTLEGRPAHSPVGEPIVLTVQAGGLVPRALPDEDLLGVASGVHFVDADTGMPLVRYDGLRVHDATGRELRSWLEVRETAVAIRVEEAGAVYPVTVDPLITSEEGKFGPNLQGLEGTAADRFGLAVSLDHDTALVGAPYDDTPAGVDAGSAYVFVRATNGVWSPQAKLLATDGGASDWFGTAVALSGETALVGAVYDDTAGGGNSGSAYVFVRGTNGAWSQQAQLVAGDGSTNDCFGTAVALSGETALVGAVYDDTAGGGNSGSAYVFVRGTNGAWSQQAQLVAGDGSTNDYFGTAVALSGDSALVGAHYDDTAGGRDAGSAYVFVRSGGLWTQQAQLVAGDGSTNDYFGYAVALSGETALVGAAWDDTAGGGNSGSAYVFVRSGGLWTQQAQLVAGDGSTNDYFGRAVALSGETALVGAYYDDTAGGRDAGSAYVFVRSGGIWTQQAQLVAGDGSTGDLFGHAVALSGETALVGAYYDDTAVGVDAGSAHVFVRSGTNWTAQARLVGDDVAQSDYFGTSVAVDTNTVLVGAVYDDTVSGTDAGSVYVFVRNGLVWSEQAKLTAPEGNPYDNFGISVAVQGDLALIGARQDDVGGDADAGSVYVFARTQVLWSQQAKLTASDRAGGDKFGIAVGLSGDTAVVGSYLDDVDGVPDAGSAYVFVQNGGNWTQQAKLVSGAGGTNDQFGRAVAISGNTILASALYEDTVAGLDAGSAYVFVRATNGVWSRQARLTAADGSVGALFGVSVGLSGDVAVVGASEASTSVGPKAGTAYVFARSGSNWMHQAKLAPTDAAEGDEFGRVVAVDGRTVVVGAIYDETAAGPFAGSAYVFVGNTNGQWTQQAKLTAADAGSYDLFGNAVAISGDTIVVGAFWADTPVGVDSGAAYVFMRATNGVWSQQRKLDTSNNANNDYFGASVAVSGNIAVVGAYADDTAVGSDAGSAYVFTRNANGVWSQRAQFTAPDAAPYDHFGLAVAVDATTALISARWDDTAAGGDAGSVYVFTGLSGSAPSLQAKLLASDAAAGDQFGRAVALSGNTALVGAFQSSPSGRTNAGSAYVFVRSGSVWSEQARLTAGDGAAGDRFGTAVALNLDTAVVGAPYHATAAGGYAGSAYVFVRSGSSWSQQGMLVAPDGEAGDEFAAAVAVHGDTVVAGLMIDTVASKSGAGSAHVFVRQGANWTWQAKLTAADPVELAYFGRSVAVEGGTAVIGAVGANTPAATNAGAAYVFLRQGTNWSQAAKLSAGDGASGDAFGHAVALSGSALLVGAALDDTDAGVDAGSVYFYRLQQPPLITRQPVSATNAVGTTALFDVEVTGPATLTYRWYKDGLLLPWATNVTLVLTNVQPAFIGDYWVVITNSLGSVTSSVARLIIPQVDAALWQGLMAYYPLDGNAEDQSVYANHAVPQGAPVYGVDRNGQAGRAVLLNGTNQWVQAPHKDYLNGYPLTVSAWMKTSREVNTTAIVGKYSSASWNGWNLCFCAGDGTSSVVFPWYVNGYINGYIGEFGGPEFKTAPVSTGEWQHVVFIVDTNRAFLVLNGVMVAATELRGTLIRATTTQPLRIGLYGGNPGGLPHFEGLIDDVRIYNRALGTNEAVQLYHSEAGQPVITQQPVSRTNALGSLASFSVLASGATPLTYQWRKDGVNVTAGAGVAGGTGPNLWLTNVQANQGGSYDVVIANAYGSATSQVATLTVLSSSPASRSAWQMHQGVGPVPFGFVSPRHGDQVEYQFAQIPAANSGGWGSAPDPETIGFNAFSLLDGFGCREAGAFTYFQTFLDVPSTLAVTNFFLSLGRVDDGARVTVYNSSYPTGVVTAGSYVFSGSGSTTNLAGQLRAGELNRVVLTQVDDCRVGSAVEDVRLWLNGVQLPAQPLELGPVVTTSPLSQAIGFGSNATLSVVATGRTPLGYQWRKEGVPLAGATNVALVITSMQFSFVGNYTVVVTNLYGNATSSVAAVSLVRANPAIATLPTGSPITYGQTLAASTLTGGSVSVPGSFAYGTPSLAPNAGSTNVTVVFTPSDTNNYTITTTNITVLVNKAAAVVALGSLSQLYNGTARSVTVSTTPTNLLVALTYNGATNPPVNAGSYTVVGTVVDLNYAGAATNLLVVGKATPAITTAPMGSPITYGQTLASSTLTGGAAGVAGAFAYLTPTLAPNAGSTNVTVVFTPTDTNNYTTATTNITVLVNKAGAVVTLGNLSQTYNGTARAATATTIPTNLVVALTYNGSSNPPTNAGNYTVIGSVVDANYAGAVTNTLAISKATPVVSAGPAGSAITYGQTLAASTLTGGSVSVPGSFAYVSPTLAPTAGSTNVAVVFRPLDTNNYNSVTTNITLLVNKAAATVTLANLSQTYNGTPKCATATTTPAGLAVTLTYAGSTNCPSDPGNYSVIGTVVDANYAGSATNTLVIAGTPPAVVQQPLSRTNQAGNLASFSVTASGPGTLTYQWRRGGTNVTAGTGVAGVTASTLWLTNVQPTQAGSYSVVVGNAYGSVTSAVAVLTVTGPPVITAQPQSVTNGLGGTATFNVTATGAAPLTYQWRKNGIALPGATNAVLTLANLRAVAVGSYQVVVANGLGSATSTVATLTLNGVNSGEWAGLVAYYPFNGNANDESGFGNHGTINGAWLDADRYGQTARACLVAGTNTSYVQLPDGPAFQTTDYTVSLWFQALRWPSSTNGTAMLLSKGQNNFELQLGSPVSLPNGVSGLRFWPRQIPGGGAQYWDAPAGSFVTNDWNHLVATFSPSANQVRLYLNGRQLTLTGTGSVTNGPDLAGPARLGARVGGAADTAFLGRLDDVRIYNRALTAVEARQVYQSESPDTDGDGLADAQEQGFSRYQIVAGQMTWLQAKADAEARGGHLATVTSQAEWDSILAVLGPQALYAFGNGVVWLGASDAEVEGQWRWVTGERWNYTRWYPGEPSQQFGGGNEDYLLTWWDNPEDGQPGWNDGDGPPLNGFQGYLLEYGYYTDPRNPDTDSDGFGDGDELAAGTSPVDASSVPPNRFSQFVLVANTPGGGLVIPDPFLSGYASNRLVTVTATPAAGWSFMGWQGDASGSAPVRTLTMSRSLCVQGVFGTPLVREVIGSGSVRLVPEAATYPYGTVVSLVAEPAPGNYFVRWTNAVVGPQNPRTYTTVAANPLLTARFAPLDPGNYALTVIPEGAGTVSTTPATNQYPSGTLVRIFAQPATGQAFVGWTGDASGTANPLTVTMDRSRVVTAVFTRSVSMEVVSCVGRLAPGSFRIAVSGRLGDRYEVQLSPDMSAWAPWAVVTNTLGSAQWTDPTAGSDAGRFYRVLLVP